MMKRNRVVLSVFVFTLTVCAMASVVLAAEHPGQSMEHQATVPISSSSTSTPQIATAQGSISDVDLQAHSLKLTAEGGNVLNLTLDPSTTTVWQGSQMLHLSDLKAGEKVKVRYTAKEGNKQLAAKSIDIVESPVTSASAATTASGK